jgi:hypothetical protein
VKFEVLYHFSQGPIHLIETKRLDVPVSAGPGEIYQWHFVEDESVSLLHFETMNLKPQTRVFSEGTILLDLNSCRGEIRGKKIELIRQDKMSEKLRSLIRQSLEQKELKFSST